MWRPFSGKLKNKGSRLTFLRKLESPVAAFGCHGKTAGMTHRVVYTLEPEGHGATVHGRSVPTGRVRAGYTGLPCYGPSTTYGIWRGTIFLPGYARPASHCPGMPDPPPTARTTPPTARSTPPTALSPSP